MKPVIVRIPPSPTGLLHLGTARTALFNYLFAKHHEGKMVFRWEDTDKERSKSEFESAILAGLKWLGMDFEKEAFLFTRQTDNTESHKEVLEKLWKEEKVFPCFTTPEELDALREKAQKEKKNFVFWSPFRNMSKEELKAQMQSGKKYVWRLKMSRDKKICFTDLVKGNIEVNTETLGDFAVARNDGSVLYLLANVVDDLMDNISHVIRGDDHISNTPKQLCILEALQEEPFEYAHIPLILDHKKRKLSKRNVEPGTCVLIEDFRKEGFVPEAVLNGLVFLGWNPKSTEELFSIEDLIQRFTLDGVNPAGSQYDFEKMKWFNGKWMNQLSLETIQQYYENWSKEALSEKGVQALDVARGKAKVLGDIQEELQYFVQDPGAPGDLILHEKFGVTEAVAKSVITNVLTYVQEQESLDDPDTIKQDLIVLIKEMELKNGTFLWPLRITLSNREKSASPFEIMAVLGKEETIRRLERVL